MCTHLIFLLLPEENLCVFLLYLCNETPNQSTIISGLIDTGQGGLDARLRCHGGILLLAHGMLLAWDKP